MKIRVVKPGMLTTIQDRGRFGFQKSGVSVGGAMDTFAMRMANAVIGNDENSPVLEMTLKGPVLHIEEGGWTAVCGADFMAEVDGEPLPLWRPVYIRSGAVLTFQTANAGCRAYLAVQGGFRATVEMGSASTNLHGQFGGLNGRRLIAGDLLETMETGQEKRSASFAGPFMTVPWFVSTQLFPEYNLYPVVRVIPGPEYETFTEESREHFFEHSYKISTHSDRMGIRLEGPSLERMERSELLSEAVTVGTIQVLPDGRPLVLMADRQTTGGYPRIGYVANVDIPVLAQLKPGSSVEFELITHDEAEKYYIAQERDINVLKQGVAAKWKEVLEA